MKLVKAMFGVIILVTVMIGCQEEKQTPENPETRELTAEFPTGETVSLELGGWEASIMPFPISEVTMEIVSLSEAPLPTMSNVEVLGGGILKLGPSGEFNGYVPLNIRIPAENVPSLFTEGGISQSIVVAHWNEEIELWIPQPSVVKVEEDVVSVTTKLSHFSYFEMLLTDARIHSLRVTLPPPSGGLLGLALYAYLSDPVEAKLIKRRINIFDWMPDVDQVVASWTIDPRDLSNPWYGGFEDWDPGLYTLVIIEGNIVIWEQDIRLGEPHLPSENVEHLAQQYLPVVSFHEDELYSPVALDADYFKKARVTVPFATEWNKVVEGQEAIDYLATHGHNNAIIQQSYSEEWELSALPPGHVNVNKIKVYWTAQEDGDRLFLTYWFFYHHDKKIGFFADPIASHNRDRESVTVVLNNSSGEYEPEGVLYYGHLSDQHMQMLEHPIGNELGNLPDPWPNGYLALTWDSIDRVCQHLVIYVAEGSHAIYPRDGRYVVIINNRPDYEEDAGGGAVFCPEGVEGEPCTDGKMIRLNELEHLPFGESLSSASAWRHLSFAGFWIDGFLLKGNGRFPPFARFDSIPDFDGSYADGERYGPVSVWQVDQCVTEDCVDVDGDGYGVGADCLGTDCDDGDPGVWVDCVGCVDLDGDGHSVYHVSQCPAGDDECDSDPFNWTILGCGSCVDSDGDGYGTDCDQGGDCDDADVAIWVGCLVGQVSTISGNGAHVCVIKSGGIVWCWGANGFGQLGNGTTTSSATPIQVVGIFDVVGIATDGQTCVVKNNGILWCWGWNNEGQLGDGTSTNSATPLQVLGISNVASIAAGNWHTCVAKSDGIAWCWGHNFYGQCGDGTIVSSYTPVQVFGLTSIVSVSAGEFHSCALKSDGTVWCWGLNGESQLGDGTQVRSDFPVQVSGLANVVSISAGVYHTCAIRSDGTVWCWGWNASGQLGDGTIVDGIIPVQVSGLFNVVHVSPFYEHTCAVDGSGDAWCWGKNQYGQLGDGTTIDSLIPVQVSGLSNIAGISGGHYQTCVVMDNGTVWCWGRNYAGQLGNGTTTDSLIPVQVIGL